MRYYVLPFIVQNLKSSDYNINVIIFHCQHITITHMKQWQCWQIYSDWRCTSIGRQKYAILAIHEPPMRRYLRSKKPTIMNPIAQSVTHTPHSFCSHPEVAEWKRLRKTVSIQSLSLIDSIVSRVPTLSDHDCKRVFN